MVSGRLIQPGIFEQLQIGNFIFGKDFVPIYSSVHIDRSKTHPECTPFGDHKDVDNIRIRQTEISYDKNFIFPSSFAEDDLTTKQTISFLRNGIKIKVEIDRDDYVYRYGVVFPVGSVDLLLEEEPSNHFEVINFMRTWERRWNDQTYISLPIVSLNGNKNTVSFFCPIDFNSQFFMQDKCLKISTSTKYSKELIIYVVFHEEEAKKKYVELMPEADSFVNFWKTLQNKIQITHGIQFRWDLKITGFAKAKFDSITEGDAGKFIEIFSRELDSYPFPLSSINITQITLVQNLFRKEKISGLFKNNQILIDVGRDEFSCCQTLHHEIFHAMQQLCPTEKLAEYKEQWDNSRSALPEMLKQNGFAEESATLYSYMTCDPYLIDSLANDIATLRNLIAVIENIYQQTSEKPLAWRKQAIQPRWRTHDPSIDNIDQSKDSIARPTEHKQSIYLLCGMRGCGLGLVQKYLEKAEIPSGVTLDIIRQPGNKKVISISLEDQGELTRLVSNIECKLIWVIRKPKDHAIKYLVDNGITGLNEMENAVENIIQKWIDINSEIMNLSVHLDCVTIWYNQLFIDDRGIIGEVYRFLHADIENFESFIDYDVLTRYQNDVPGLSRSLEKHSDTPLLKIYTNQ